MYLKPLVSKDNHAYIFTENLLISSFVYTEKAWLMSKFCSPDAVPSTCPWRLNLLPSVFSFSRVTLFENREAPGDAVGWHLDLLLRIA